MAKESNLVAFGGYEEDAADDDRGAIESASQGTFVKLKEGRNKLRAVPLPPGRKSPFLVVYNHFVTPHGEDSVIVVRCPRMASKGKMPCPICKEADKLNSSGNPLDRNAGYSLMPKQAAIIAVINRDKPEDGIRPLSCSPFVFERLNSFRNDPDDPCDFTHPIEGRDIWIDRKGTGKKTKYAVKLSKECPLAETVEEMNDLISAYPNLERHAQLSSDEDLLALARGEKPEGKGSPRTLSDDNRRNTSSRSSGRRRSQRDDDDAVSGEVVGDDGMPF